MSGGRAGGFYMQETAVFGRGCSRAKLMLDLMQEVLKNGLDSLLGRIRDMSTQHHCCWKRGFVARRQDFFYKMNSIQIKKLLLAMINE